MNTIKTPAANILDAMKWWGFLGSEQAGEFDDYFTEAEMKAFSDGANWQVSQYKDLVDSFRELKETLEGYTAWATSSDNYIALEQAKKDIILIEKANTILLNLKP